MSKYTITLCDLASEILERRASEENISPETLATEILHLHLVPPRIMEQETAKGYEEMGEINLALAD